MMVVSSFEMTSVDVRGPAVGSCLFWWSDRGWAVVFGHGAWFWVVGAWFWVVGVAMKWRKKCAEPDFAALQWSCDWRQNNKVLPTCTTLIGAIARTVWRGMALGLSSGVAPRRRVVELLVVDLVVRVVPDG